MRPLLLLLLLAPCAYGGADPIADIRGLADSALAAERNLYWLKCRQAIRAGHASRRLALQGLGTFLANVPLEYAASRYRQARRKEPVALNGAAFVLVSISLLQFGLSYRRYEEYQAGRACCRLWQDYASR